MLKRNATRVCIWQHGKLTNFYNSCVNSENRGQYNWNNCNKYQRTHVSTLQEKNMCKFSALIFRQSWNDVRDIFAISTTEAVLFMLPIFVTMTYRTLTRSLTKQNKNFYFQHSGKSLRLFAARAKFEFNWFTMISCWESNRSRN